MSSPEYRSILADIKKRNFAPLYILMGEEPFYIDKITEALEQSVVAEEDKEFDQTILYGADISGANILEAASIFPMMSERRLVLVKEAQAMANAKSQLDKLAKFATHPLPSTVLVVAFKGDKLNATSELLKEAKKNKSVVIFDSPKLKEYRLPEVIKDFCSSLGVSIDDRAVELLVANVGASLTSLYSELEKLKLNLKPGVTRINADDVLESTGVSKEFNNFELVSALATRDYYKAVRIVKQFESNPKSSPTQQTCGYIFAFYQKLVIATFSKEKTDSALMAALGVKSSYALRDIRAALPRYNASQAVKAIRLIREFDTKSKGIDSMQKEYPLLLELVIALLTL